MTKKEINDYDAEHVCLFCGNLEEEHYEEYEKYYECNCEGAKETRRIEDAIRSLQRQLPQKKFKLIKKTFVVESKKNSMIKVYIASPYTLGDRETNVRRQIDLFKELIELGFVPFAPLWAHYQELVHHMSDEEWLRWDFAWLDQCDVVIRLDGKSAGADQEEKHANEMGIPVFHSIEEFLESSFIENFTI